jgi:beta-lactamase regulating signal transducer with metallopeptidase domain
MMTPDLYFWARLLGRVAVEAACVAGAALLLERLVRPAFWRRALWQGAVVCLLLLTASEMSGFGRGLAAFLFGRARPEQRYAVRLRSVESAPLPPPAPATTVAPAAVIVPLAAAKPEIVREVWWPGLLWLAGALAVLGRAGAAQVLFISLRRRRPILVDSDLNGRVAAILRRLNVRGKIRLLQSPGLTGPIAFGILRPSVGLPVDFAVKFSRAEQDAMLAHELAHLASRDPLWYLLADASSAALWWHPQAWWARRRLHRASELAADEAATMFPDGPAVLAGCLVTLGRQMTRFPAASRMGVEGGGFRSNLAERVQRLLRLAESARQPSYGWRSHAARFAAILTLSAAAIALSGCLQSRPAEKQPTLQANISEAWAESPAATVWHSALPQKRAEAPSAPKRVFTQLASQDKSAIVEAIRETVSLGIGEFHVEPKSFVLALRRLFPNDAGGQPIALLNRYVAGAGIDMTNANSFILFNPRTGDILARGTARNLDSLEQAIDLLKEIPPVDSVDRAGELVNKSRTNGFFFLHPQPEKAWLETGQLVQMIHVDSNTFLQGMREVFPQIPARQANPDVAVAGGVRYSPKENEDFLDSDWLSRCFASLGIMPFGNSLGF